MKSDESNRSALLLAVWLVAASACDSLAHRDPGPGPSFATPSVRPPPIAFFDASTTLPTCMRAGAAAPAGLATEGCNGWDDDCDGKIDEGFDLDGDGYSTCETANDLAVDCDDTNADVHPTQLEACDGVDNDCDDKWDEGAVTACPAPLCSRAETCPVGLVCVRAGEPCAKPAACARVTVVDTTCPAPANPFKSSGCDPTQCGRWQSGTCWGDCQCSNDGFYRWKVSCTE